MHNTIGMNANAKPAAAVKLPARLTRRDGALVPGRGDAGWTVYEFADATERDAFMLRHPDAAMPCWARIIPGSTTLRP